MNNLVVNFKLFTMQQQIFVYSEGKLVHQAEVELERVTDVVRTLCFEYGIEKVSFCGNKEYVSKFAAELNTNFSNIAVEIVY